MTYGGIARDLLTFVADFWLGTGALDRFCTSEARYKGKDPRHLLHRRHLGKIQTALTGFQNGDGEKGRRVLRFSGKSVPF